MQISVASGSASSAHELTTFDKYHLIASLGQGGMAKVYLALLAGPSDFNKLLVVKIMRQDVLSGTDEDAKLFFAEARLAARLLHPNIVHTFEVGEHEGRSFLAMEYLDGQPLSVILNRARADRDIPLAEFLRVISEVARGLHYAHHLRGFQGEELHVVHRDVSPQNVIITYEGHAKLVDFGIAKTVDADQTQLGIIKGKLDYIAPEQLRGEPLDGRADVFALGAILWEVIAGTRFAGGRKVSDLEKVQTRLSAGERKLRAVKPKVPEALERIVERAIALTPTDRFQDAASFADAIDHYLETAGLRPNPRALAAHLRTLFEGERTELHKLIDEQVQRVKRERESKDDSLVEATSTDARKLREGFGLFVNDVHQHERSSIRSMTPSATARASTVAPSESRKVGVLWTLGALAVATGVLFAWLGSRPAEIVRAPSPTQATGAATSALPSSSKASAQRPGDALAADAPATMTLRLQVTPAHARALIDGVRVALPFAGRFRKDAALHHIEVSADGYRSAKEFVAFDGDKQLELELTHVPARRSSNGLEKLIERAERTIKTNAEPSSQPASRAPAKAEEPLLERPNPYSVD